MKQHVFRLRHGDDLLLSIADYCQTHNIQAGCVSCCVGCVTEAQIRSADGRTMHRLCQRLEIVSLTGTVSKNRCHLHVSFSKENLDVVGGHLCPGCLVNTTAEIVLTEIEDVVFSKEFDPETGYNELHIEKA